MVDEDTKKRAVVELIEGLDELCSKANKDYQELLSLSLSLEDILKKIKEYTFKHELQWNKLENDLFIPYKLADRIDICKARQQLVFSDASRGLTSISLALKIIKNNTCNQCQKQLTKDSCYVYSWKNKNLNKWVMEQAQNFSGEDFRILFCSPNCFQQSSYHQDEVNQNNNKQRKNINSEKNIQQQTQPEPLHCSGHGCLQQIPTNQTYFYNPKNPQIKFCSNNCYINYCGEFCYKCKNTFLKENLFTPIKGNSHYLLCLNCYQKHQQEEKEKNKKHCFKCSAELTEFNNKKPPFSLCDFCFERDLERAKREGKEYKERMNKQKQEAQLSANNDSNPQLANLKSQISQLESSQADKSLLEKKKEELRNWEKKLNQENVQVNDNSKLYWGIGLGIFGIGLVGVVVWLVKRKNND